ncbi:hypothetical protein ANO11243_035370 [Dothideomycetidae sp. 11243]|nr:hypothetical protein ANO11243_035370 [fungal sp. No.11243]
MSSSSATIHAPSPMRPRLLTSLSTDSFSDDLAYAFAHSNAQPRVADQNIKSLKKADWVPGPPPPSPIDPALMSAGSSSASLYMATGKVNGR